MDGKPIADCIALSLCDASRVRMVMGTVIGILISLVAKDGYQDAQGRATIHYSVNIGSATQPLTTGMVSFSVGHFGLR